MAGFCLGAPFCCIKGCRTCGTTHISNGRRVITGDLRVSHFNHLIECARLPIEGRQVQISVLTRNEGAIPVTLVAVKALILGKVAGIEPHEVSIAFAILVYPPVPNIAAVVQKHKMLCVILRSIPLNALIAQAGHRHQSVGACNVQVIPEVEGNCVQIHGVLGGEEVAVVYAGNFGCFFRGEILAVRQVPERSPGCVGSAGF